MKTMRSISMFLTIYIAFMLLMYVRPENVYLTMLFYSGILLFVSVVSSGVSVGLYKDSVKDEEQKRKGKSTYGR